MPKFVQDNPFFVYKPNVSQGEMYARHYQLDPDFKGARLPLFLFAIAGLFFMNGPLQLSAISVVLLFIAHLPYAHCAPWTVYYLEAAPVALAVRATREAVASLMAKEVTW